MTPTSLSDSLTEKSTLARLNASIQTLLRLIMYPAAKTGRAVIDRILVGPPAETKKATQKGGVSVGGASFSKVEPKMLFGR